MFIYIKIREYNKKYKIFSRYTRPLKIGTDIFSTLHKLHRLLILRIIFLGNASNLLL